MAALKQADEEMGKRCERRLPCCFQARWLYRTRNQFWRVILWPDFQSPGRHATNGKCVAAVAAHAVVALYEVALFWLSLVLVLNEMVLVLVLDAESSSTSTSEAEYEKPRENTNFGLREARESQQQKSRLTAKVSGQVDVVVKNRPGHQGQKPQHSSER